MAPNQPTAARLNASEGYAGVLVAAVACDGIISNREAIDVAHALSRQTMFEGLSEKQMRALLSKLGALARERGAADLVALAAPSVPADLRATAFVNAVDLVMADDRVTDAEVEWLKKAQAALGVRDDLALKILEVIGLKNQG